MNPYKSHKTKIPFTFRLTPANRFTIPALLAILEKHKFDQYFKFNIADSPSQLLSSLKKIEPGIVAYSFMTPHLSQLWHEIQNMQRQLNSHICFIAGGPHVTGNPESALKMGFNAVLAGEGETILPQFCKDYLDRNGQFGSKIYQSHDRIDINQYLPVSSHFPFIPPLEITRGCRYQCRFCQTGLISEPVHRSLESIHDYLDSLIKQDLNQRAGFICPSGFEYGHNHPGVSHYEHLEALLSLGESKGFRFLEYGIFPSEIRPGTIKPQYLKLIRKYCSNKKLTIGAQSGSERLLKTIRRKHTLEEVERAIALVREHHLTPIVDFIIGLPDEIPEDRLVSFKWMKAMHNKYAARIQMHHFIPLSGTEWENADPALLDDQSIQILNDYYKAGICTHWWIEGLKLSRETIKTKRIIETL